MQHIQSDRSTSTRSLLGLLGLAACLAVVLGAMITSTAQGGTLTVTTTTDAGPGSLRQAIAGG